MERLWTWHGRCFGYREGNIIWTHKGLYVGELYDHEIYNRYGNYIGEIRKGRLITNIKKKGKRRRGHKPHVIQSGRVISDHGGFEKQKGYIMLVDYEDFPRY